MPGDDSPRPRCPQSRTAPATNPGIQDPHARQHAAPPTNARAISPKAPPPCHSFFAPLRLCVRSLLRGPSLLLDLPACVGASLWPPAHHLPAPAIDSTPPAHTAHPHAP